MKYRDLNHLDVLPASWTDAIQEFVSSTPNFRLTVANATTIRAVAGAGAAQAGLAVNGLWRWRTANHDVAHVAGAAGQYDIYAIASANSFTNTPSIDTDITDYNWYVVSRVAGSPPTGNTPAGNPITQTMKVGETDWDGAAITAIRSVLGMNYSARAINPTAPHAAFTPVRIRGAAGQTADLFRIEDSTGAALWRVSSAGVLVGTPAAPTAAADTNTAQIATTAFVIGQKGTANPLINGTVAPGTSLRFASQDHVHPTDTTRAASTDTRFPAGADIVAADLADGAVTPVKTSFMTVTDFAAVASIDVTIASTDRIARIEWEIETSAYAELRLAPNALATAIYSHVRDGSYEPSPTAPTAVAASGTLLDNNGCRLAMLPAVGAAGGLFMSGHAVFQCRVLANANRACISNVAVGSISGSANHIIEVQQIASKMASNASLTSLRFAVSTGTMTGRITVTHY